jgi:hypothetical protein
VYLIPVFVAPLSVVYSAYQQFIFVPLVHVFNNLIVLCSVPYSCPLSSCQVYVLHMPVVSAYILCVLCALYA